VFWCGAYNRVVLEYKPIVILGPTAGGKSALAVDLAERLPGLEAGGVGGGEVVGADAFQVYRHLDAGTAKPEPALRNRVPHHLIDIVQPTERFTVHDWLKRAHAAIADIKSRGRRPVIVGGTNLYLKALLDGMFDGPGQDMEFRASLEGIDTPLLHDRLSRVDGESAARIKPADRQRIVRALEVYELTGQPISTMQTQWGGETSQGLDATLVGLRWSPEEINPRINLRVKAMFYPEKVDPQLAAAVCINNESLVDEVRRLKKDGLFEPVKDHQSSINHQQSTSPNQAREGLGYKQVLAWLEGTDPQIKTLEDAFEKTKVLTRRFAKQQRTWLKRFTKTKWIDCEGKHAGEIAERACELLTRAS